MSGRLVDISPPVTEALAVWPGDEPFRREVSLDMASGDDVTLSSIRTTLHVGAHADAPAHFDAAGSGIGEQPLETYFGPCQVIAVDVPRGGRVRPSDLPVPVRAPRVLIRTDSCPDRSTFRSDFAGLSPELIEHLHVEGVVLVGIDTPSVDPADDEALLTHRALARAGMANLEGLVLSDAPPGPYTLIALPLRLPGCDASPVRAALLAET